MFSTMGVKLNANLNAQGRLLTTVHVLHGNFDFSVFNVGKSDEKHLK